MKIYRAGDPDPIEVADVKIDDSTVYTRELMGAHKVDANWILPTPLELNLGDYVVIGSEKFYLNRPVQINKENNITFRHEAIFEGEVYTLYRKILKDELEMSRFPYFGDPELYLQLIIDNINSIDPGWTFDLDLPVTYGPKAMDFDEVSCRVALTSIMEEFKLEFRLVQKTIIVREDVGFPSVYSFEYGRGNGMYSLTRDNVAQKDVVTRLYGYGGDKNIPLSYRDGLGRLVFETGDPAKRYIEENVGIYGIREGSITFPEIYPRRTGSISAVNSNVKVVDSTLDFDINDHLISGVVAKIVFKSGSLSGYEFDISAYNHGTKEITFIPKEEVGSPIPDEESFQPEVGDQYTLVNIEMPESYVIAAEAELLAATQGAHIKLKSPQVVYGLNMDEKYVRTNGIDLDCGLQVAVVDSDLGLDETIRIYAVTFPLVNPSRIQAQITDVIPLTIQERYVKSVGDTKKEVIKVDRTREENYRENAVRFRNLQNKIYDPDGYFNGENIRPNSIETLMLSVGAKSQNFLLNEVEIEANYLGDANTLRISGGYLIHLEIEITGLGFTWEMDPNIIEDLTPASFYYVYAKCNKSVLTGEWVVSETPINTDSVAGFYHFWLGLLYPVKNSQRYFMFTKGMTYVVGDTITTGKIQSLDGLTFFDLTGNNFNVGSPESGLDWDISNPGALTIRGAVIASAVLADDGIIANLKVKSLKTAESGKRIEILAFSDPEETNPVHNMKFYDDDGNLALTIDTEIDAGYVGEGYETAGLKLQKDGSDLISLMTQRGLLSDGSFMSHPQLSSLFQGSVIGVLKDSVFSAFGRAAGVIGWDGDPSPSVPTFGGLFNSLLAMGLHLGVRKLFTNDDYQILPDESIISSYNTSTINLTLPENPKEGRMLFIRRNSTGAINVLISDAQIYQKGPLNSASLDASNGRGRVVCLLFDGDFWLWNFMQV